MIPCQLCHKDDHETCGCWETVEVIEVTPEEMAQVEIALYQPTMQ